MRTYRRTGTARFLRDLAPLITLVALMLPGIAHSAASTALKECTALSTQANDIHNCMDNYLDVLDSNMDGMANRLRGELSGKPLKAFKRSQKSFIDFRKTNCLWYLEFSAPREQAEQIAKNCLVTMSEQRIAELKSLLEAEERAENILRGYYVYGANRNSFKLCGGKQRFWVEGGSDVISKLQQDYLQIATAEMQILHVELDGEIDDTATAPQDHSGVIRVAKVNELRVPREADCNIPSTPTTPVSKQAAPTPEVKAEEPVNVIDVQIGGDTSKPEQKLRAYFGAWLAECVQDGAKKLCDLMVEDDAGMSLDLTRRDQDRTVVTLKFPNMEIDSPSKIRWKIDEFVIGDIASARIRVDENGTRQLLAERKFIRDELIPLMKKGTTFSAEVVGDVDDAQGKLFSVTLIGLTKAMEFADGFVNSVD